MTIVSLLIKFFADESLIDRNTNVSRTFSDNRFSISLSNKFFMLSFTSYLISDSENADVVRKSSGVSREERGFHDRELKKVYESPLSDHDVIFK